MLKSVFSLIFVLLYFSYVYAEETMYIRLMAGLDFFPSFLAADKNIKSKTTLNGYLRIILLYKNNEKKAEKLAALIKEVKTIRDIPLIVTTVRHKNLNDYKMEPIAGIFIIEPIYKNINHIIEFSGKHQCILFSPFNGDIEKGVVAGISVSDMVLPYININSMRKYNIQLKEFFMQTAKKYYK